MHMIRSISCSTGHVAQHGITPSCARPVRSLFATCQAWVAICVSQYIQAKPANSVMCDMLCLSMQAVLAARPGSSDPSLATALLHGWSLFHHAQVTLQAGTGHTWTARSPCWLLSRQASWKHLHVPLSTWCMTFKPDTRLTVMASRTTTVDLCMLCSPSSQSLVFRLCRALLCCLCVCTGHCPLGPLWRTAGSGSCNCMCTYRAYTSTPSGCTLPSGYRFPAQHQQHCTRRQQ
jgi:hypothetical protein